MGLLLGLLKARKMRTLGLSWRRTWPLLHCGRAPPLLSKEAGATWGLLGGRRFRIINLYDFPIDCRRRIRKKKKETEGKQKGPNQSSS